MRIVVCVKQVPEVSELGFDPETRDVIEKFDFDAQIGRLDRAKLLYLVLSKVTGASGSGFRGPVEGGTAAC